MTLVTEEVGRESSGGTAGKDILGRLRRPAGATSEERLAGARALVELLARNWTRRQPYGFWRRGGDGGCP